MDAGKHFLWASLILGFASIIMVVARDWGRAAFCGFLFLLALICLFSWNAGNKK